MSVAWQMEVESLLMSVGCRFHSLTGKDFLYTYQILYHDFIDNAYKV